MPSIRRTLNRAITIVATLGLTSTAAAIFVILQFPENTWSHSIWTGTSSGLLIGIPVLLWMSYGLETDPCRRLKRLPLLAYLVVNTAVMTGLLLAGHFLVYHVIWGHEEDFFEDPDLRASMIFSVLLVAVVSIAVELRRLIGPGVFGAVLAGRYRYPRTERRVFLLVDVIGSTQLAERLGPGRFLTFLDRWIHVLSEPLLVSGGSIYRYIGDEVILTWDWTPDAPARALGFAVEATAAIATSAADFRREFGEVPRMRVALHAGPVIAGEIGDMKREITFLGDTVNTAARIAGEVRKYDGFALASAAALEGVSLPAGLTRRDLGPIELRGKAEPVPLTLILAAD